MDDRYTAQLSRITNRKDEDQLQSLYANESFWSAPKLQDNFLLTALGVSENINGRLEIASILDE